MKRKHSKRFPKSPGQRLKPAIEKEIEKRSITILESDGREIKNKKTAASECFAISILQTLRRKIATLNCYNYLEKS